MASTPGSRLIGTGLFILSLSVSAGVSFGGGYGLLLGLLGILAAVNIISLGVWQADHPAAAAPVVILGPGGGGGAGVTAAVFLRRRKLAVVGIMLASSAILPAVAAAGSDQTLCLPGVFALLLLGVGLINVSVFLDGAA